MSKSSPTRADAPDLFDAPMLPDGFKYRPDVISADEEHELVERFGTLPFKEFEFHGFVGKRRVVSFGWRYDFNQGGLQKTEEIPPFLLPLRQRAAGFAGLSADAFEQVLLTEYRPGASIGWHRDRSVFGEVIGLSLGAACIFRMRRKAGAGWERATIEMTPRSAYLLAGAARRDWEHSIPALEARRYSVTFRNFARR
jgi:alkylated DNA repair dioxygenase AlkB